LKVYNQDGKLRYDGIFENGNLINGKRYEYNINGLEFMTIQYDNGQYSKGEININGTIYIRGNFKENKFSEGYKKIFDNNNKLIYEGNLYDGKYHGKGKKYEKDGSWYDGEFNNNRFVRGVKKNVLIEDTESDYLWQREQWEIENLLDDKYQEYQEELLEEQMQEHIIGKQVYADLEYMENGIRIIESSKKVVDKYDIEYEHLFK